MGNPGRMKRFGMRFLLPFFQLYLVRGKDMDGNWVEMVTVADDIRKAVSHCNMDGLRLEEVYPVRHA